METRAGPSQVCTHRKRADATIAPALTSWSTVPSPEEEGGHLYADRADVPKPRVIGHARAWEALRLAAKIGSIRTVENVGLSAGRGVLLSGAWPYNEEQVGGVWGGERTNVTASRHPTPPSTVSYTVTPLHRHVVSPPTFTGRGRWGGRGGARRGGEKASRRWSWRSSSKRSWWEEHRRNDSERAVVVARVEGSVGAQLTPAGGVRQIASVVVPRRGKLVQGELVVQELREPVALTTQSPPPPPPPLFFFFLIPSPGYLTCELTPLSLSRTLTSPSWRPTAASGRSGATRREAGTCPPPSTSPKQLRPSLLWRRRRRRRLWAVTRRPTPSSRPRPRCPPPATLTTPEARC